MAAGHREVDRLATNMVLLLKSYFKKPKHNQKRQFVKKHNRQSTKSITWGAARCTSCIACTADSRFQIIYDAKQVYFKKQNISKGKSIDFKTKTIKT